MRVQGGQCTLQRILPTARNVSALPIHLIHSPAFLVYKFAAFTKLAPVKPNFGQSSNDLRDLRSSALTRSASKRAQAVFIIPGLVPT